MQVPVGSRVFFTLQSRLNLARSYMTGQIADLENEMTLAWEMLGQRILAMDVNVLLQFGASLKCWH